MSQTHTSYAALKEQVLGRRKKALRTRKLPRLASISIYASIFIVIITFVAIGYQPPKKVNNAVTLNTSSSLSLNNEAKPSVDQLVATTLAGDIAQRANLPIVSNVAELSVSLDNKDQLSQSDESTIVKPQIIEFTDNIREVRTYLTVEGDNVQTVADKFKISPTTLKWANNLQADALDVNKELKIPPTNGVIYTIKQGDTADSIAQKYNVEASRVVTYNDLEIEGFIPGKQIVLPNANLPETERPGYVAPVIRTATTSYSSGSVSGGQSNYLSASAGNRYAPGYCTWYVYERRAAAGNPIGSFWGNAVSWASSARAAGFVVNNQPSPGAIMQNGGGYGHVAYVESVGADGTVTVREMNYVGFNVISSRTLSASQAAGYNFIH